MPKLKNNGLTLNSLEKLETAEFVLAESVYDVIPVNIAGPYPLLPAFTVSWGHLLEPVYSGFII